MRRSRCLSRHGKEAFYGTVSEDLQSRHSFRHGNLGGYGNRGPLSVSPGRKRGGVYTAAGSGRKTCGKTIAPQIHGKWDPGKASRGTVSYVPTYKEMRGRLGTKMASSCGLSCPRFPQCTPGIQGAPGGSCGRAAHISCPPGRSGPGFLKNRGKICNRTRKHFQKSKIFSFSYCKYAGF